MLKIEWVHIPICSFLVTSTTMAWIAASLFFGNLPKDTFDTPALVLAYGHLYGIIPMVVYFTMFTKFNNPFKKVIKP